MVKSAVVQATPHLFDRESSVEKVCELIHEAASAGARIIVFPEAFIPAYPRGLSFGIVVGSRSDEGRRLWQRYWDASVSIPSAATEAIAAAAREATAFVSVGIIERDTDFGGGTLFCTSLYIGPDGKILGKHRKLKPTAAERLIWGEGDGSTLSVVETPHGRIGGLICWENYMPMARMAMYSKGVQIYLAPTADARESWQATLKHIALEGRCFVLGCNQFLTKADYPEELEGSGADLDNQPEVMCRGGSAIVSPFGKYLAEPLWDREGILYAELDLHEITRAKLDFDAVGHYARADVFRLDINESPALPVRLGRGD